tara:strand:- start:9498 stop:10169 length:672 start_codon:yes stop_codon:yes gene_type:complete
VTIGCIIQARSGSRRLKNKIFLKIKEKNLLEILILRLLQSKKINKIIIATTNLKSDNKVHKVAKKYKLNSFSGSENNVLKRYYDCAKKFKINTIVRITADCPLTDPKLVDNLIDYHFKKKSDYTSNVNPRTFPDGLDIEILKFSVLKKNITKISSSSDLEHVTPYFRRSKKIKKINYKLKKNLSKIRWTIDYKKDYDFIKKLFKKIKYNIYLNWEEIYKIMLK